MLAHPEQVLAKQVLAWELGVRQVLEQHFRCWLSNYVPKCHVLGSKISVCSPQAKQNLLFGSKIMKCAQFGASEGGVGSRNQVLARLILTPGSEPVLE